MSKPFKIKICFVRKVTVDRINEVDSNDYERVVTVTDKNGDQIRLVLKGSTEQDLLFGGMTG